jgi:PPP family 3-phenylpropionic acid transporter
MVEPNSNPGRQNQDSNGNLFLLKLYNLSFFAAFAAIMPFLVIYYQDLGTALPPLMTLVGSAVWGAIADITSQYRRILGVSITGASLFGFLIVFYSTFQALVPIVLAYAFFISPIVPLLDNSVLESLKDRTEQYGRFRLWGALGWGLSAPVVGTIAEKFGLDLSFYIYLVLMIIGLLVALKMPVAQTGIGGDFRKGFRLLLKERQTQVFFLTMLFVGIGVTLIDIFLFLHLQALGATKSLMGLTLTVGTISEIFIFIFADRLIRRFGTVKLLVLSILALALQLLAYSVLNVPGFALVIQILHGPSFAGMWSAGVAIANQVAPKGMGATAQGLFSSVFLGVGGVIGSIVGGFLLDRVGTPRTFAWTGIWVLLCGFSFFMISRRNEKAGFRTS